MKLSDFWFSPVSSLSLSIDSDAEVLYSEFFFVVSNAEMVFCGCLELTPCFQKEAMSYKKS